MSGTMVPNSTIQAPMSGAEQIKERITQLQEALQQRLPSYEGLLQVIHTNLAKSSDTVHLLTEDEIGVIVAGLQKKTGVFITQEAAKSKGKKEKIQLDDL